MHVIFGRTVVNAIIHAKCQYGWSRISRLDFNNNQGEHVRVIFKAEQLRGIKAGKIYLCPDYERADNYDAVLAMASEREFAFTDLPGIT